MDINVVLDLNILLRKQLQKNTKGIPGIYLYSKIPSSFHMFNK